MNRALTWVALAAATSLTLAACTDDTDPTAPTSSEAGTDVGTGSQSPDDVAGTSAAPDGGTATDDAASTSAGPINTFVPVAAGTERAWPEAIDTITKDGKEFTLFGVHRLAEGRVVVTGRIVGESQSTTASAEWFEPGYFRTMGGYEFSNVAVRGEDGVSHLPVRDADDRCLCSLSTQPYDGLEGPEAPAWVVLSAPSGVDTLDVEVMGIGTLEDVLVTDLPSTSSTPFGWAEVLTVESLAREAGTVTARATIANPSDLDPTYTLARHQFSFPELETQNCFQGLTAWSATDPTGRMAKDDQCHVGSMPPSGQQISLDVAVADPGGDQVVLLPDAGLPLVAQAAGTAAEGPAESLRTYAARTEQAGATVEQGEELTVNLDTEVLFEFDEATLTSEADEALAVAVETLQAQDGRAIVVAGHTDGQGSAERNMELSEQRAQAVAEALEEQLGDGWDITVEWHGMSRPAVEETGTPEQVEAAQARNRRVEIVVP
ncbi:OmpA family protein [Ornithinimicrobium panacihumi]|uniref:OmpA family protein n=1 Tax=Ornithinimicrobium panacihumi TaxID=2008449 RepID=UPI003F8C3E4D